MVNNLSILQQNTLKMLEQLEYVLESKKNIGKSKIDILFGDIDFNVLKKPTDLYVVSGSLKESGLNFVITFDLVNDDPSMFLNGKCQSEDYVKLGYIETIDKKNLRGIINKIRREISGNNSNNKKDIKIFISLNDYEIIVGKNKISFDSSSLEWAILFIINKNKAESSWEDILEYYNGDKPSETLECKKRVGDARDRVNRKIIKNTYLKDGLVLRRNNQYKFSKNVTESD